ncbi:fibropellin-1-like [Penaeus monodon]|uniref:fibropellin-1-like n=1 Tax=Penaeus monodon TaxID=6687 RepID=UPI0018A74E0D|nr:fibropellin-1-like [Penaeus monodon]
MTATLSWGVGGTTGSPVATIVTSTENDTSVSLHIPLVPFYPCPYNAFLVTKLPPASAGTPSCKDNYNCKDTQLCYGGVCVDGFSVSKCGYKAQCHTVHHIPMCTCVPGSSCAQCVRDSDCSFAESCRGGSCVDPCVVGAPCGRNAECAVTLHRPICSCPAGYTGNPRQECLKAPTVPPGCTSDFDCIETKVCYDRDCKDPCGLANPCAAKATCTTVSHRPVCTCNPGYSGNPYVFCGVDNISTGCRGDGDCPSTQACINNDCRYPCEDDPCGINAECINSEHSAQCRCRNGFQGDPLKGCTPGKLVTPTGTESDHFLLYMFLHFFLGIS